MRVRICTSHGASKHCRRFVDASLSGFFIGTVRHHISFLQLPATNHSLISCCATYVTLPPFIRPFEANDLLYLLLLVSTYSTTALIYFLGLISSSSQSNTVYSASLRIVSMPSFKTSPILCGVAEGFNVRIFTFTFIVTSIYNLYDSFNEPLSYNTYQRPQIRKTKHINQYQSE